MAKGHLEELPGPPFSGLKGSATQEELATQGQDAVIEARKYRIVRQGLHQGRTERLRFKLVAIKEWVYRMEIREKGFRNVWRYPLEYLF